MAGDFFKNCKKFLEVQYNKQAQRNIFMPDKLECEMHCIMELTSSMQNLAFRLYRAVNNFVLNCQKTRTLNCTSPAN